MKVAVALLAVVAMTLAGCNAPITPDDPTPSGFDGDAAYAWVENIVYLDDGSLRPRDPGSDGHDDTVAWLQTQLASNGWAVALDTFTGTDYDALDKGAVERYTTDAYCRDEDRAQLPGLSFTNLYATLPGTEPGGGHVVLAAHWDAKEDARDGHGPIPAANDGASGMGVLLELQDHLAAAGTTLPFDLTIAFFDGEDGFEDCHPLAGSLWAARNGSLPDVTQLILLDMVGDADARFIQESQSVSSDGLLVQAIWTAAHDQGLEENFVATRKPIVDDHVPFIEEGIPAVDIIDGGRSSGTFPPYWHTTEDTPDKLSAHMLGAIGDLMVQILTDPETQALLTD